MNERERKRLEQIRDEFSRGMSVEMIAGNYGVSRETVEAVIRQAMKLADREGMTR